MGRHFARGLFSGRRTNWPEDAEHPPVGASRDLTGIGERDEADLDSGSEQNTQQEEDAREREIREISVLEDVGGG